MKVTMGKFHYDDDSYWWWGTTSTTSDTVGGPSHYDFISTSFSEKRIMSNSVVVASTSTSTSTTRRIVSLWLTIVLSLLCFTSSSNYYCAATTENNLQYKEYWYKTEQLCPDLQESVAGKDIDTANYPYKSVFRFMDHLQSVSEHFADLPCILEANGPQRQVSTALIEAIHVDTRPWNYSRAQTCEEHIKLRLPEPTFLKRSSSVPQIICRIRKSKSGSKEATGSLYHPYVWQFQKDKKLGLSFSSFNLSHLIQPTESTVNVNNMTLLTTSDPSADNSTQNQQPQKQRPAAVVGKNYWLEPDPSGHQFVQIVFSTRFGRTCNVRVQQYMVDSDKTLCEGVQQRSPFRLCGLYDCSEKESILRSLGFWSHRKDHEQLDFLLQAEIPRWRREDPTYLEILVSTLRALIMPLLFLSVFYVTRRLRLKLANRHYLSTSRSSGLDRHRSVLRQRQCYLRSLMRDGGGNTYMNSSSSDTSAEHMLRPSLILNHVVYDIPVSGAGDYPPYDDLPPPYESVVDPPTYFESTANVKTTSTNLPTQSHPSSSPERSPPPPVATTSSSAAHSPSSPNTMPVSNSHRHHHHHSSQNSIIDEEMVQLISPLPLVPPPSSATASSTSSSPPPPHNSSHLST